MTVSLKDLYKLLDDIDHHARAITRLHSELRSMLATISIPEEARLPCPVCKLPMKGPRSLALHIQNVHDGPPAPLSPLEELELAAHGDPSNDSSEPVT